MLKRLLWIVVIPLVLALVLSACGVNMSGEPKIVQQQEILPAPTTAPTTPATPAPTQADVVAAAQIPSAAEQTPSAAEQTPSAADTTPASSEPVGVDLSAADYNLGFQLFVANCAQCHGAQDSPQGPGLATMRDNAAARIESVPPDEYIYQSIVDPGAYVVDGYQNPMPTGFGTQFSAQELNSLVKFILEFDPSTMMSGAAAAAGGTPTPVAAGEGVLAVRGHLIQGTADGAPIPSGLTVELYALDVDGNLIAAYDTISADGGAFDFESVTRAAGDMYLIQVTYDDVPQGAQINPIQGDERELTQDVTVYERTTDTSDIAISWAQMLINFAPIEDFGLEVWLRLEIVNNTDRIVTTDETAGPNGWFVSATMQLPVGSFGIQPMQSENSQRYAVDVVDGVPIVKDTWPLRPGQVHSITVAYYLPYDNGAVIDQAFDYPVIDGAVLVPNDTVEFTSDQFDATGTWRYRVSHGGVRVTELQPNETINPDKDFTLVKEHELLKPVAANDRIIFELAGRPTHTMDVIATTPTLNSGDSTGNSNTLPLVLAGAGLAIIMMGGVLWWRQRATVQVPSSTGTWQPPDPSEGKEALLKAITTLDDAYDAGHVDADLYEERRAILTERLLPLLDDDDRDS
jgi:mono/diheme cytochrome c family protein